MAWIGALVGAGLGLIGSSKQANASSQAAGDQYQAEMAGIQQQQQEFQTVQQEYGPQRNLGYGADQLLAQLYGIPNPNAVDTNSIYPANNNPQTGVAQYGQGAGSNFQPGAYSQYGFSPNQGMEDLLHGTGTSTNTPTMRPNGAGSNPGSGMQPAYNFGGSWNGTGSTPSNGAGGSNGQYPTASNSMQINPFRGGTPTTGNGQTPPGTNAPASAPQGSAPPGASTYDQGLVGAMSSANPQFSNFYNSPGFQFSLGLGQSAINRNAAASGGLYTPNTMANLSQYTVGQASGQYNNYVQQLMGLAGLGGSATAGTAGAALQTGNNVTQLTQNAGAANASGVLGSANAWSGAANQVGGAAAQVPWATLFGGNNTNSSVLSNGGPANLGMGDQ